MAKPATKPKDDPSPAKAKSPPNLGDNSVSPDELKAHYRDMLLIRRFEERAGQLYGMGLIGGFCHLYIGQEAVVVGMQANVRDKDAVITSYRDHGHMLACGMDPKGVMAELTGRSGGYSKGKGGSMHMFSREKSFYGGHGIVGAQVPIGTGLAFAHKYNGNKNVSLTYFGDGSANQGQVYEAMNMAALWKLPVVYIIENNRTAWAPRSSAPRPPPNSIATARPSASPASGWTAWTCWRCGRPARRPSSTRAAGRGRTSSRCKTYRYRGHSMSDPAKYRTKEEVDKFRNERDPIEHIRKRLLDGKIIDEAGLKAIDTEIRKIVNDAAEFSQHSPEPDPSELWTDILVEA
jgi:pyruvate dehydrogenase E1 component alpha subunit